jgi:hypothetical protein
LESVTFSGNAPPENDGTYNLSPSATNYVTNPTATGWGATFGGRPVVRSPLYGSADNQTGCPIGAVSTNIYVSVPASNSAAGLIGQIAKGITGGTNFLYLYDPSGGGAGTSRWLRVEGSVTW